MNQIEKFSLENLKTQVTFVSNYDGDTLDIIIPLCCKQYIFRCRLQGIDTPELRTKNNIEKEHALKAKHFLFNKISKNNLYAHCHKFDKYGRVLCTLYLSQDDLLNETNSVNMDLIHNGLAVTYDGKTKHIWNFKQTLDTENEL